MAEVMLFLSLQGIRYFSVPQCCSRMGCEAHQSVQWIPVVEQL